MSTIEKLNVVHELNVPVTNYRSSKSVDTALTLGKAIIEIRKRCADAADDSIDTANQIEEFFCRCFNISDATVRRIKLLAIWEKEVLTRSPKTLTMAYGIAESLNSEALQRDDKTINRGGRPRKSEVDKSLEQLRQAVQYSSASGRPASEFIERTKNEIEMQWSFAKQSSNSEISDQL